MLTSSVLGLTSADDNHDQRGGMFTASDPVHPPIQRFRRGSEALCAGQAGFVRRVMVPEQLGGRDAPSDHGRSIDLPIAQLNERPRPAPALVHARHVPCGRFCHDRPMPSNEVDAALARMADLEDRIETLTAEIDRLQRIIAAAGIPAGSA